MTFMNKSRRRFLSTSASFVGGLHLSLDSRHLEEQTAQQAVPSAGPGGGPSPRPKVSDDSVAFTFCKYAESFPRVSGDPHLAMLAYGLICLDPKGELLFPSTKILGELHGHHPRLYALQPHSGRTPTNTVTIGSDTLYYWDLAGINLSWEPVGKENLLAKSRQSGLEEERIGGHPWSGKQWLRDLNQLTGKKLISIDERSNRNLVSARVAIDAAEFDAVAPHTPYGALYKWSATNHKQKVIDQATTDAVVLTQSWANATAVRFNFRTLDGKTASGDPLTIQFDGSRVRVAVTHASHADSTPNTLTDAKAYALLLKNLDPEDFPKISISRGARGERYMSPGELSVVGGHCEFAISKR